MIGAGAIPWCWHVGQSSGGTGWEMSRIHYVEMGIVVEFHLAWPSRLNFETVSLQSPRHCCIQKIYITIRRTIWGNKFKRKLCPRILQFSGTTSVWEKENWDVNFVPTSFPWYCDKILPIINNRMERKLVTLFISFWTFMHARVLKHKRIMCMR